MALLSSFASSTATAQETAVEKTAEATAPPPGWALSCGAASAQEPLQCRMAQELFSAEAKARVLAVSVAMARSGTGYEMTLALPHGVYLPDGVTLAIDGGQAIKSVVESSNASGIFAVLPMDEALASAIKRGDTMLVGITSMGGKPLKIPVSLAGFTAAYTRIQALK